MYQKIYVPVDNSGHSNRAIDQALALGGSYGSKLVGCHVYAARMHDYRFKQMEYTLPEEYLVETELARQRKIHDSLITMGLELISDCYLERIDALAKEAGIECERRMMDGKHSAEILKDLEAADDVDLVVLGAVGIGRTKDSQLGSVAARVARETTKDTWVVKHVPSANGKEPEPERDTVMVGVDGSPESFGALMLGVELARRFGKRLEVVAVYDPYLHYAAFRGIAEVLTERAAKVFRFEEQNQLHEEIIDTGLAEIYQSHLNVAESMAREAGAEVTKTLLDGKAFQKVLDHARKVEPWVLVIGRVGVHAGDGEERLGSNAETLLRLAPCDVLLTNRRVVPELDLKASESIHWTPEAEERMGRVPEQVKGIARTAILRLAIEKGHSVVSSDLVTEAMERFMPKGTAKATERLAEALAFEKARREEVSLCKGCGIAARVPDPVRCTVCGGTDFEVVAPEVIDEIAAAEGGTTEERTYDGRKLAWTQDARKALRAIPDRYQRRRAKARIEKAAHGQRLETITFEHAQRFIEEETGVLYQAADLVGIEAEDSADAGEDGAAAEGGNGNGAHDEAGDGDLNLIARDAANNPLLSRFDWTDDAVARVLRVPAGFMRDRTQTRIEELAAERRAEIIDLRLVEDGIEHGRRMMAEMLGQMEAGKKEGNGAAAGEADGGSQAAQGEACPVEHEADAPASRPEASDDHPRLALNEVSVMSEMERKRRGLRSS
ncbi:MAG TPA: universal stress protein [Thermoanaerobaculia bacterium]|nr:universal stress protein [Thermoanaerobaculia bacterium]